tara:strand:- start:12 stop:1169 length:1158 start_codon:yes stop_codon:yes gene_type:complete
MRLLLTTISVFVLVQIALSQKRVQLEMLKERDGVMFHHSKPFNGIALDIREEYLVVGYESISYEYKYKNGLKHGESKAFYENQNTLYTEHYNHGKKNGICKGYYKNGEIASVNSYKNGKRDGVRIIYYPSGNMMDSCNYVNDKKNGFHYRWDDSKNNELAEKKFFKDGRYTSKFERYINETGFVHFDSLKLKNNTKSKTKFVKIRNLPKNITILGIALRLGIELMESTLLPSIPDNEYYNNLELFSGEVLKFQSIGGAYYHLNFKKGKLKKLVCFSHDKKILMAEFDDGKINGSYTAWNTEIDYGNGLSGEKFSFTYHKSLQAEFSEGRLNGIYRIWHNNGQLKKEGNLKGNKHQGVFKEYNEEGKLIKKETYNKRGKLIKTETF